MSKINTKDITRNTASSNGNFFGRKSHTFVCIWKDLETFEKGHGHKAKSGINQL